MRFGRFGQFWCGEVGRVKVCSGLVGLARRGRLRYGEVRIGKVRHGRRGLVRRGESRSGGASHGKAGLESQKGVDVEVGRNGRKAVFILGEQVQSTC